MDDLQIMKPGNSIRVKNGVKAPDYEDLTIEDWCGRIIEMDDKFVTIELDSITLSELNENYIIDSLVNEYDYTILNLEKDEVEVVNPRDTKEDVLHKQREIYSMYSCDEEEKRIIEILKTDDIFVNNDNLKEYFNYLKLSIKIPCILTGMEDFDWEEPYLLGGWSSKEYEKLKKTKPSYTDEFEFLSLCEDYDDWKGLQVKVKRLSDKKVFSLPLWDLEVIDKKDPNYIMVSDYSLWMTNYR